MKKWFIHILLLAGLFGMLTTSCSQDEVVEQSGTTNGTVRIQFTLDMDGNSASRAETWNGITGNATDNTDNDERKVGSIYENTVNIGQLQVFLFQGTRYLGEVGGLSLDNGSGTNKNTYTFRGEVTVHNATVTSNTLTDATIMVVANYDGFVNGNLAITQNYIFDYIAGAYSASAQNKKYIPMWGMLKPTGGIPLNESTDVVSFTAIGNIYMLRSLAKIEVVMGDGIDPGYTFTGATLGKYNKKGNLLPAVPSGSTYLSQTSTSVFHTENCKNPVSSSDNTPLAFEVANGGRSCVLYVPEYSSSSKDLNINLQISKNGTPISDNLEQKGTFTLNSTDLVRNHWYKCTVNQINDGYSMDLTCVVQDWTLVEEFWDYSDQATHSDNGELVFGNLVDGEFVPYDELSEEIVTYGDDLHCSFQLQTPINATWHAEFITVSGDQNAFVFVTENGTSSTVSGEVGTPAMLVIRPANATISQNNSALLRISVQTADNRTFVVKTLLPENLGNVKEYTIIHSK